ncbi:MAG: FAD-binding oxidoreductase [Armatimonadetes bacterium]|nr:FAD-binding oxidoreductase [Armatimonadota bacterium]
MPLPEPARSELRRLLGEENLREGAAAAEFSVQGRSPAAVLFPGSMEEAAGCAGVCHRFGLAVAPWGGGTRMGFGSPPARLDLVLCTARMDRVVDYQPADMTVTVEAGLPLAQLQRILGEQGQFLPLDPPRPERATLGGIIATRDTGALRHAYGSPRDLLIGLRVADPEGKIVRGGSKVVKNVAGYDLPKLYTGSWGTLGLLAELTFRVLPLPERRETVAITVTSPDDAESILAAAMDSDLMPAFIELLNGPAGAALLPAHAPGLRLVFGLDGAREDVEWQVERLSGFARTVAGAQTDRLDGEVGQAFRRSVADFPLAVDSRLTARVVVRSSDAAGMMADAETLGEETGHRIMGVAHAGVGILVLHATGDTAAAGETAAFLNRLREQAASRGGRVTVERAAPDLEGRIAPWPDAGDGLPVMENLKRALDPKGLWNPGRFVVR